MSHSNIAIFIPHLGCPNNCSFCDQKAISGEIKKVTPEDVDAILREAFTHNLDCGDTEIAFFGGSFTCLPTEEMMGFLKAAYPYVKEEKAKGIRISTRPDGITRDVLEILRHYGVTSIELGAQSLDDEVLRLNRRGHTGEDVRRAAFLIKEYGFSLGLQIMTGLYGDHKESLYKTARGVILIKPDTVRIYPTVVIEGTYLDKLRINGDFSPVSVEESSEICAELMKMFDKNGIKIIRVGLHASETLEGKITGGAYHPAFREICESIIKRDFLLKEFEKYEKGSEVTVYVPKNEVSVTVGHKKSNIIWAEKLGYKLVVKPVNE